MSGVAFVLSLIAIHITLYLIYYMENIAEKEMNDLEERLTALEQALDEYNDDTKHEVNVVIDKESGYVDETW